LFFYLSDGNIFNKNFYPSFLFSIFFLLFSFFDGKFFITIFLPEFCVFGCKSFLLQIFQCVSQNFSFKFLSPKFFFSRKFFLKNFFSKKRQKITKKEKKHTVGKSRPQLTGDRKLASPYQSFPT